MIGSHGPVPRPAAPSNSFPPNYGPRPPMYPGNYIYNENDDT